MRGILYVRYRPLTVTSLAMKPFPFDALTGLKPLRKICDQRYKGGGTNMGCEPDVGIPEHRDKLLTPLSAHSDAENRWGQTALPCECGASTLLASDQKRWPHQAESEVEMKQRNVR